MTRTTNARLAGFTFLFYIAVGLTSMALFPGGEGVDEKLSAIAENETTARVAFLLSFSTSFCALVLAATLYAITRDQDPNLAMLALTCRVAEGLIGTGIPVSLGLLWLATASHIPDTATAHTLGALLVKIGEWDTLISGTFFAVGSTLFSFLFLRGRTIPEPLAWLGVFASVLLVVTLPLQLAGFLIGPVTQFIWIPMLVFEIPLGLWLLIKGVAVPSTDYREDHA